MELRSAKTLAKDFDLSPFTIRRLGWEGRIREFRRGKAVRYSPQELWKLMEAEARVRDARRNPRAFRKRERRV